jgi:toxin ParE1/3/4
VKLRFSLRATADIAAIADYLNERSSQGAASVRASIQQTLANVAAFPRLGRLQSIEDVRKVKTRRYPYLIYYRIDTEADEIVILTIQHAAREREIEES